MDLLYLIRRLHRGDEEASALVRRAYLWESRAMQIFQFPRVGPLGHVRPKFSYGTPDAPWFPTRSLTERNVMPYIYASWSTA